MANQEKEDEEDGLGQAPYYVPQSRSLSRLSKMDSYRVRFLAFPVCVVLRKWLVPHSVHISCLSFPLKVVLSSSNVAGYLPMTPGVDNNVSKMPSSP